MEVIDKYFPDLTPKQRDAFAALGPLYREWNQKINVISRKDIDHLYEHHVLHSLALAKYNVFTDGMQVLDVGTGGGFPGIPLAILYPGTDFVLIDSVAKKIRVVLEVAEALRLENVQAIHGRAEQHHGKFDLITGRAVTTLTQLVDWTKHLAKQWVVLKGGDQKAIRKELPPLYSMEFIPVSRFFEEAYFREKWIVNINFQGK